MFASQLWRDRVRLPGEPSLHLAPTSHMHTAQALVAPTTVLALTFVRHLVCLSCRDATRPPQLQSFFFCQTDTSQTTVCAISPILHFWFCSAACLAAVCA